MKLHIKVKFISVILFVILPGTYYPVALRRRRMSDVSGAVIGHVGRNPGGGEGGGRDRGGGGLVNIQDGSCSGGDGWLAVGGRAMRNWSVNGLYRRRRDMGPTYLKLALVLCLTL